MALFSFEQFFDLQEFEHSSIFQPHADLWDVIKNILNYLTSRQLGSIQGVIDSGSYLVNPEEISIGEGTVVEPGAYIAGPCMIGKNCQIRHGAYIRGGVILGDGCVIGHATEVKNAIFLNEAHAGHFAYVGDSIIGNRVNLGAGVKCANVRCDRKPVTISFNGRKVETGLRKMGAIIGDLTQIGCNAVTNPGTLIGKGSICYPTLSLSGFIPENSHVKNTERHLAQKQKQLAS